MANSTFPISSIWPSWVNLSVSGKYDWVRSCTVTSVARAGSVVLRVALLILFPISLLEKEF